jgi:hypothetical protein
LREKVLAGYNPGRSGTDICGYSSKGLTGIYPLRVV